MLAIGLCLLVFYAIIEAIWFSITMPVYRSFFTRFSRDGHLRVRSMGAAVLSYAAVAIGAAYFVIAPSCTVDEGQNTASSILGALVTLGRTLK